MLIIEGPDNVGKTTAARALAAMMAEELKLDSSRCYRHLSKPPDDFAHLREYMERVGAHVQDRFHLGAITYGRLTGNGSCPSASTMLLVQRYLRWQGCLVVVMHAERDWLRRSQFNKNEMYRLDTILDVSDAFRALLRTTNRGEPYHDVEHDVSRKGYPDEQTLRGWLAVWRARWSA